MFRYFNELSNRLIAEEMENPGPVRWYHHLNRFLFANAIVYGVAALVFSPVPAGVVFLQVVIVSLGVYRLALNER